MIRRRIDHSVGRGSHQPALALMSEGHWRPRMFFGAFELARSLLVVVCAKGAWRRKRLLKQCHVLGVRGRGGEGGRFFKHVIPPRP